MYQFKVQNITLISWFCLCPGICWPAMQSLWASLLLLLNLVTSPSGFFTRTRKMYVIILINDTLCTESPKDDHSVIYSCLSCLFLQTSEYIIQAYKYGAFEKIPEFIAFRNRLNHSLHFAQVRTERMLLDLFLEADMLVALSLPVPVFSAT